MITASIVLYHPDEAELKRAVESWAPSQDRLLYLLDNSEEGTDLSFLPENPYIEYIPNGKNLGYGTANNIALQKAFALNSEYHVILNPDVYFKPEDIDTLKAYMDSHPGTAYLLPKVIYPDGRLQYLCKLLPKPSDLIFRRFLPSSLTKKSNDRYELRMSGYDHVFNPPCLSGCFMFLRTSFLKEQNLLFDERFFMYCEDFDLMRRIHRTARTEFYPDVTIVHDHQRGSYKNLKLLFTHIHSAVKYFNKYGWFFDEERKEMNQKILQELEEYNRTERLR